MAIKCYNREIHNRLNYKTFQKEGFQGQCGDYMRIGSGAGNIIYGMLQVMAEQQSRGRTHNELCTLESSEEISRTVLVVSK